MMTIMLAGNLAADFACRAAQVRKAIEQLGPTYVKVAQALSPWVNVLDCNYQMEIDSLHVRVPPSPTKDVVKVMAEGQDCSGHHSLICFLEPHQCGCGWKSVLHSGTLVWQPALYLHMSRRKCLVNASAAATLS